MTLSQSEVIGYIERHLIANGWKVAFSSRPNRAHVGVVPISTSSAYGKQRYPDVVATNGSVVRLIEVEPVLTAAVLREITSRFSDHIQALSEPDRYQKWAAAVLKRTGVRLPDVFLPLCELVVIRNSKNAPKTHFQPIPDGDDFEIVEARQYTRE